MTQTQTQKRGRGRPPTVTGKLQVTISRSMHAAIIEGAERNGAALSKFVDAVLRGVGRTAGLLAMYDRGMEN